MHDEVESNQTLNSIYMLIKNNKWLSNDLTIILYSIVLLVRDWRKLPTHTYFLQSHKIACNRKCRVVKFYLIIYYSLLTYKILFMMSCGFFNIAFVRDILIYVWLAANHCLTIYVEYLIGIEVDPEPDPLLKDPY